MLLARLPSRPNGLSTLDTMVLSSNLFVDYIYTDTFSRNSLESEKGWNISLLRLLLSLMDAANYFALPELRRTVEASAGRQMKKSRDVAILFLGHL